MRWSAALPIAAACSRSGLLVKSSSMRMRSTGPGGASSDWREAAWELRPWVLPRCVGISRIGGPAHALGSARAAAWAVVMTRLSACRSATIPAISCQRDGEFAVLASHVQRLIGRDLTGLKRVAPLEKIMAKVRQIPFSL